MMKRFIIVGMVAMLAACGGSEAPTSNSEETTQEQGTAPALLMPLPNNTSTDITSEDLAVRIKTLSDDKFEGRGPGTPAGENSADWIAQEMARIGIKPGADGTYFQTVGMVEQTVNPENSFVSMSFASSDGEFGETILPVLGEDTVIWTKRQNADEVSVEDSEIIFVGYGVNAPEYGWNDYKGLDVEGKTVVMLVNDPGFANPEGDLFRGRAMTYYGRWTYKYEEAARQGAAAAFVIHETEPASYGWDVVSSSWSGAQADLVRKGGGADRVAVEGWFHLDTAKQIFEYNDLDFDVLKTAAASPNFKPVAFENSFLSARVTQSIDTRTSNNVAGIVEGTTRPDEYVLYTAHWDHIGVKPGEGDNIYNGAVDNATGTAGILEIGEALVAAKPERSSILLAVTLEESGLLGSAYYAENPLVPLHKTIAGINIDGMLPTGRAKDMIVVGYGASEMEGLLKEVLTKQDRIIVPDPRPEAGFFYRSDHISLAKKGVPMLYADGGLDLREGGPAAGLEIANDYTAHDYHAPSDEYSDDWNLAGMVEDITALYEVGLGVANSSDMVEWYDGSEFKAIREASLAEAN